MNRPMGYAGVVALALVATSVSAQEPLISPITGTRLDVVATGDVSAVPDIASIGAGVVTEAATASAALGENSTRMAATIAALRKAGVADRDLQTTAVNLSPRYRYQDNQPPVITGYQATSRVSVRFRDVKNAGKILDSLVAAGANQIDGPSLSVDHPEALLDQARQKAVADAQARASLYARATGLRVKRIVAISEGSSEVPVVRPQYLAMSARKSEAADTAIEAGEQKLSISLSVTFELE